MTQHSNSPRQLPWVPMLITMCITFGLLTIVNNVVKPPILLLERIVEGGGWIQVGVATLLSGFFYALMANRKERSKWRIRLWLLFSVVFFTQLLLGITVDTLFLMSGKLHFPIPALIPLGALYRGEIGFMPILFFVTILLSSGAWCSQLCYFGVYDAIAAGKPHKKNGLTLSYGMRRNIRMTILSLFIVVVIVMRYFDYSALVATILAAIVGVVGIAIILLASRGRGVMLHCSSYCPAGTLVTYLKKISPWGFEINSNCTHCMACTRSCRYDALTPRSIKEQRIANHCTLCGDCLTACRHSALEYKFMGMRAAWAEKAWLVTTISLYTCFLFIARI
ncbi:MAG: 4Fe-4S binding protein [Marinifilaceae bacterium]